ncbi:hypothetical protein [Paludifilum halophilum]|nr:hypothetical protein [Paludifilum halophilum]
MGEEKRPRYPMPKKPKAPREPYPQPMPEYPRPMPKYPKHMPYCPPMHMPQMPMSPMMPMGPCGNPMHMDPGMMREMYRQMKKCHRMEEMMMERFMRPYGSDTAFPSDESSSSNYR